jgi:hypothetical protein
LLDAPHFVNSISPEQQSLLEANEDYSAVVPLINIIKSAGATTPAALIEATRNAPDDELYRDARSRNLDSPPNPEDVRIELEGIFDHLEKRAVETEYEQLNAKSPKSAAEEHRFRQVARRMAELKGAGGVGLPPPT